VNVEFHYYLLNFICRKAGFAEQDAHLIAYASQFVDNNIFTYEVDTASATYRTVPTQNWGFWSVDTPRDVYIPFHFFPGDPDFPGAARIDGRTNPLNCTPDSPGAKQLLIAALKSRDPYRIGIALHTYADTWAHQNFTGIREEWNVCDERSLIPPIGHAQVLSAPDQLTAQWSDPRLQPGQQMVRNRLRVLAAARKIYKYLATYNRRSFDDADLVVDYLDGMLGSAGSERPMEERILDYMITEGTPRYERAEWLTEALATTDLPDDSAIAGYDKLLWLKDEILHRTRLVPKKSVPAKNGFYSSHFYRFIEAAKAQLEAARSIFSRELHLVV